MTVTTIPKALGMRLSKMLEDRRGLLVSGCGNALAARLIENMGFEAIYLSGAGSNHAHRGSEACNIKHWL